MSSNICFIFQPSVRKQHNSGYKHKVLLSVMISILFICVAILNFFHFIDDEYICTMSRQI